MATIATTFTLNDRVSNGMNNIRNSVENTNKSFSSMTEKLIAVNSAMDIVGKGFDFIENVAHQAIGTISGLVQTAGEYEGLMAQLTTSIGDATEAQNEFNKLKDFAARTPFDLPGVVQASTMFRNAGVEAEKVIPTIQMIGDLAQGNNEYFQRMALNFMQIKSVGKATMMDLNQFGMMGVPMKQMLADMGVEGQATAEQVEEAMKRMTSAGGQFYNSMMNNANTLSGIMSNFGDTMEQTSSVIGNVFIGTVKDLIRATESFFSELTQTYAFSTLMVNMKNACQFIRDNLDTLIAIMVQVGTVAVTVASVMATAWIVAHWPIALIILGITTIIRLMYDSAQTANETSLEVSGSFNQVSQSLSTLFGIVSGIGAVMGTIFNSVYNAVASVINIILSLSEHIVNFANWFAHPIQSVKNMFLNLASDILDILSSVLGIFSKKLSKSINEANAKLNKFRLDQTPDLLHYDKFELADTKSIVDSVNSGAKYGAEIGSIIDNKLNFRTTATDPFAGDHIPEKYKKYMENMAKLEPPKLPEMPEIPEPPKLPELPKLKVDSSGNLKTSVENEIKISDEFKQLLSQQAVEKYKMKYQSVTPTINLGGINVSSDMDVDGVIEKLATELSEVASSSLSVI